MNVTVKLFARARDLAGSGQVSLELPAGCRVRELRRALAARYPELSPLTPNLLVAVANEYVRDDAVVSASDEIACFPPVSGG